jgi:cell division septum initiation protein DivIVA
VNGDDLDDLYPPDDPGDHAHHDDRPDTEAMLLRLRDIVESSRSMPMSSSVLVNRDDVLDLLDMTLEGLPEELRRARWLLKEREEFLGQARREADEIVESGRVQVQRMVERTEMMREARRRAQQVTSDAEAQARALRHEAEDYIDQKLAAFEVVLDRIMQQVQKGRERLQVVIELPPDDAAPGDERIGAESTFFDQDSL